jgi:hypothetical protein
MKIKGTVAELTRNGSVTDFLLHVAGGQDTRVQTASSLAADIKNGDLVEVSGNMPPDPPFLADSVTKVTLDHPSKIPWKWIAIGVGACVVLVIAFVLLGGSKDRWTIQVSDSGLPAANLSIQLSNKTNPSLQQATTDSNGQVVFTNITSGSYTATGPGGAKVSVTADGKTSQTSTMQVHSPYMWTIRTQVCTTPSPGQSAALTGPTTQTVTTNAQGQYTFANLQLGSYSAKSGTGVATAKIDGKTVPAMGLLNVQAVPCYRIPPERLGVRFPTAAVQP